MPVGVEVGEREGVFEGESPPPVSLAYVPTGSVFASGWNVVMTLAGVLVMLFVRVTVREGEGEGGVGVVDGDAVMLLDGVKVGVVLGVGDDDGCVLFDQVGVRVGVTDGVVVSVDVVLGVVDGVRELDDVCVTDGVEDPVGLDVGVALAGTDTVGVNEFVSEVEAVADMVRLGQAEAETDAEGEGVALMLAEAEMLADGSPSKTRGVVGFSSSSGNWRSSAASSPSPLLSSAAPFDSVLKMADPRAA